MSKTLEFERNIEDACIAFLKANELPAWRSRDIQDLPTNNIQVMLDYGGALQGTRQVRAGYQEYDTHTGTLVVQVTTFRETNIDHHTLIGKVRALMLNGNNGFGVNGYTIFDLMPEATTTIEDENVNADQTQMPYQIRWRVNLDGVA